MIRLVITDQEGQEIYRTFPDQKIAEAYVKGMRWLLPDHTFRIEEASNANDYSKDFTLHGKD